MNDLSHPEHWKYNSPESSGLHKVVNPDNSALKLTHVYRLNLSRGEKQLLQFEHLEYNALVVKGSVEINNSEESDELSVRDSFYSPSGKTVEIKAIKDSVIYIGAGPCEDKGRFFIRKFDPGLPVGNIRQVHGEVPFRRDVFMTIAQEDRGSRLICGVTSGDPGAWTSWPPHQHSDDLEEVYFYFDIPSPSFALHLCSRVQGKVEYIHQVSSGDCVIIPEGYHPTIGMPGIPSTYFWIMTAHAPESRRYDLAINDPSFDN